MKLDSEMLRGMLDKLRDESKKPVNNDHQVADYMDKMFNFGVDHMYFVIMEKLDEAERIARGVSA